jgi:hypothetical protein
MSARARLPSRRVGGAVALSSSSSNADAEEDGRAGEASAEARPARVGGGVASAGGGHKGGRGRADRLPAPAAPRKRVSSSVQQAEGVLLKWFTSAPLFCEAVRGRAESQRPGSLSSLERRWFAGKQTHRSANMIAKDMTDERGTLLTSHQDVSGKLVWRPIVIGTAVLIQLGRSESCPIASTVEPRASSMEYLELAVTVPTTARGRPKKGVRTQDRVCPRRTYCESPRVYAVSPCPFCRRWFSLRAAAEWRVHSPCYRHPPEHRQRVQ